MAKQRMIQLTEKGYAALGMKPPLSANLLRMKAFARMQELLLRGFDGPYAKGYNEGVRDAMKILRDCDG
jgi:hypothetical protein